MPVVFNEPLSFLQRMTEYMEYARLLRLASEQENAADRMKYVAAFAVSALASNWERLGKPFNPLLGETYEYKNAEFRVICEQVSNFFYIFQFIDFGGFKKKKNENNILF